MGKSEVLSVFYVQKPKTFGSKPKLQTALTPNPSHNTWEWQHHDVVMFSS